MSLRARLLAGMAVVSFVLVAAAVIIARTTESYLVDRVDDQLALVPARFGSVDQFPGLPLGGQPQTPSAFFSAQIVDGSVVVRFRPSVVASGSGTPRISVARGHRRRPVGQVLHRRHDERLRPLPDARRS